MNELTDKEKAILALTSEAFNTFLELPDLTDFEKEDFSRAIRTAENQIMARVAVRTNPETVR